MFLTILTAGGGQKSKYAMCLILFLRIMSQTIRFPLNDFTMTAREGDI